MNAHSKASPLETVHAGLNRLQMQITSWQDNYPELAELKDLLDAVDPQALAARPNSEEVVRALVKLARETMLIRLKARKTDNSSPLAHLEVPAYDLWLPFKTG